MTSARFIVHFPGPGGSDKVYGSFAEDDFSEWHTFAVDWLPDRIVYYVDGVERFRVTDRNIIPDKPMHLAMQFDQGPKKDWIRAGHTTPAAFSLQVDWLRVYAPALPELGPGLSDPCGRTGACSPRRRSPPRSACRRPRASRPRSSPRPPEPALVVAGAGSGKTETMAARVVWLVANGLVLPEQVLGLTFTRKAARQLGDRVRRRLRRLAGSRLLDELDPTGARRAAVLAGEPTVADLPRLRRAAGRRARLRLPAEPGARLLTETGAWQLAHRVVATWADDLDVDRVPATVTGYVLALAGELAEHLRRARRRPGARRRRWPRSLDGRRRGPSGSGPSRRRRYGDGSPRSGCGSRCCRWSRRTRRASAPSARWTSATRWRSRPGSPREHPEVGAIERGRYRAVLLDEYQDTGHAQRVLLRSLFGAARRTGRAIPVTAVGDPCQSIYGWRGASAGNLPRFRTDFPAPDGGARRRVRPAHQLPQPAGGARARQRGLRAAARGPGAVGVGELRAPGRARGAGRRARRAAARRRGRARLDGRRRSPTRWQRRGGRRRGAAPTAAVLVRRRADMRRSPPRCGPAACRSRWSAWAGCSTPRRCATWSARCGCWPTRSPGGRGAAADRRRGGGSAPPTWRRSGRGRGSSAPGAAVRSAPLTAAELALGALPGEHAEQAGLVDALDDPGGPARYSPAGYPRLRRLAGELRRLRRGSTPLPDLVADIERAAAARRRDRRPARPASAARTWTRSPTWSRTSPPGPRSPTLPALLAYLAAAERAEDGLAPGEVEVGARPRADPHRARGEGPGVGGRGGAAPGRRRCSPAARSAAAGYGRSRAARPAARRRRGPARADAARAGRRPKVIEAALTAHDEALRRPAGSRGAPAGLRGADPRRARAALSGHWWGATGTSRGAVGVPRSRCATRSRAPAWGASSSGPTSPSRRRANPATARAVTASGRPTRSARGRPAVHAGAELVRAALRRWQRRAARADARPQRRRADRRPRPTPGARDRPIRRAGPPRSTCCSPSARAARAARRVALPAHLSVTQLVELRRRPGRAGPRGCAGRCRCRPNPHARRGTAFHAWLEQRFGAARLLDLDELPGAADEGAAPDDAARELQEAFLAAVGRPRARTRSRCRSRPRSTGSSCAAGWTRCSPTPTAAGRWSTGRPARCPTGPPAAGAAVQLAAYRLAWAALAGCPLERVRAAFHYVRHDVPCARRTCSTPTACARCCRGPGGRAHPLLAVARRRRPPHPARRVRQPHDMCDSRRRVRRPDEREPGPLDVGDLGVGVDSAISGRGPSRPPRRSAT